MIAILSPAKKLDFKSVLPPGEWTQNRFLDQAEILVRAFRKLKPKDWQKIMKISPALADLTYERYQNWQLPFLPTNARPALFTFNGEAYNGLNSSSFTDENIAYAQDHLRILSALYGLIRPLDLIMPYRVEMGMPFKLRNKNLYAIWSKKITDKLIEDLEAQGDSYVINLASEEYSKVIDFSHTKLERVDVVFKQNKNGQYKINAMAAKKARGLMSAFIIKNKIQKVEDLIAFDLEGYYWSGEESTINKMVFLQA